MVHQIKILNPVEAWISPDLERQTKPCLSYTTICYIPGIHHKRRIENKKSVCRRIKGGFIFYAGLVDRLVDYCKENKIEVAVEDQSQEDYVMYEPKLSGITFREDQDFSINAWLDKPRGILKAPTGTGKTVLGFGCLSSFEDVTILWLCHTADLMKQAYNEAVKFGWKSIGRKGDGYNECGKKLTIATRQTFQNIADAESDLYDVVVVDEVHHVSSFEGEYHYILSRMLAPFRLGLTASELKEGLPTLAAIGLIGPIISELTIPEAMELGLLAIPKMKMLKTSVSQAVKNLRKYPEVYEKGIVHRLERNQLIANTAKFHVDKGETVLIMVTQLVHGDNIKEALRVIGIESILVEGATKSSMRDITKESLIAKSILCVICTVVWKEGINIPSLDCVINAAGGKDPLQGLGRGLRKTAEKDVLWYYDIFDPSHRYLIEHFGIRLCWYLDNNWL